MNKCSPRTFVIRFILYTLCCAIGAAGLTAILDPWQIYHRAYGYTPYLSNEQRYQNPGLALRYDYDTIIIGTSMTENFLPSEVDQALGGKTMKLSIRGSTSDEHYKMAKLALSTGKVKKVLWGLDYFSLKTGTEEDFPDYLYDQRWWNDYPYWFNYSVYQQFAKSLWRTWQGAQDQDMEYLYNWNDDVVFGKEEVANAYAKANSEEAYFSLNEEPIDVLQQRFRTDILSLVKEYPDVEFIFYYPPYSILRQSVWYYSNPTRFENQLEMRSWMYEELSNHENASVYDFQASDWTHHLDLYKDLSHHNQEVNSWIIQAIDRKDANYLMTSAHAKEWNAKLESDARTALLDQDLHIQHVNVQVNGESVTFANKVLRDDEILVSVKEAAALLEADVEWNASTRTMMIRKGSTELELVIGKTEGTFRQDREETLLSLADKPELIGGISYVPLSFVAHVFQVGDVQVNVISTPSKSD